MKSPPRESDEHDTLERPRVALLAVDLGLRTGLAGFARDGRLIEYESRNYGTMARLKRAVPALLRARPGLEHVFLEGGGTIAELWRHELERREIPCRIVSAETWRKDLLYPRLQRSGDQAKLSAQTVARRVIERSPARKTKSLTDDAAEAILLGLWAAWKVAWLKSPPKIAD